MLTVTEWPGIGKVVWNGARIAECPAAPPRIAANAPIEAQTWYESRGGQKRFVRGFTLDGEIIYRMFGGVRAHRCTLEDFETWRGAK